MPFQAGRRWQWAALSASLVPLLWVSFPAPAAADSLSSSKRGLTFTPNTKWPQDNTLWVREPTDLTWYYNYGASPSPEYSNLTQDVFEFVPMFWGAPSDVSDTTFLTTVKGLISETGVNVTRALGFNEPDGSTGTGGSNIEPSVAARVWVNNMIPLQDMGVRLGLPACTSGPSGLPWLKQFLANCSQLISSSHETKNCTYDFIPLHYYGDFEGLASHIGEYYGTFPNSTIWVTEYNNNDQDLTATQSFYNTSAAYLDRLTYVERYSLFGAFRSKVSSVGPNAAMLSDGGDLTDIGAWYLGRDATGVKPESIAVPGVRASSGAALVVALLSVGLLVGL